MKAKMLFDEAQSQPIRNYFMSNEISVSMGPLCVTKQKPSNQQNLSLIATLQNTDWICPWKAAFIAFLSYNMSD